MEVKKHFLRITLMLAVFWIPSFAFAFDYEQAIEGIAHDIARVGITYPQLKDFSATEHLKPANYSISYGYHTHRSAQRGGWRSGVPNPDADGVWFYIDFHSATSTLQIHTQPSAMPYCVGTMRLSFLILEGTKTRSIESMIWNILKKHGVTECNL
jgi:hypothetical protein